MNKFDMLKLIKGKGLKWKILMALAPFFFWLIITLIVIMLILGPIMQLVDLIGQAVKDTGGFFENLGNWFAGRGFKTNEDAFQVRLNELNTQYGVRLDFPLIAATLYYPYDVAYDKETAECLDKTSENAGDECSSYNYDYDDSDSGNNTQDGTTDDDTNSKALNVDRLNALANHMLTPGMPTPDYEAYDTYLRTDYIKNSAEFGYPWGLSEDTEKGLISNRVETIIRDIHDRSAAFNGVFGFGINLSFIYGDARFKEMMEKGTIISPINEPYHITQCFTPTHDGIDVILDGDTSIKSIAEGTIVELVNNVTSSCDNCNVPESRGNYLKISYKLDSTDDQLYYVYYEHLASVESTLAVGNTVKQGDKLGVVGNTGKASNIHLHFSIYKDGKSLNGGYIFPKPTSWGEGCYAEDATTEGAPTNLQWPNPKVLARYPWAANLRDQIMNDPNISEYRKKIIDRGLVLVGWLPYFWGGKSSAIGWDKKWLKLEWEDRSGKHPPEPSSWKPKGLDCSGFVNWTYRNAGIMTIVHGSSNQCTGRGKPLNKNYSILIPGDLVCRKGHVAIYLGEYNGKYYVMESFDGVQIHNIIRGHLIFTKYTRADYYINKQIAKEGG